MTSQTVSGQARTPRPTLAFLLSLISGVAMVSFSSGLGSYTQYYFITNVQVQDTFLVGVLTVFVGALLYQRPKEHIVWSLVMVTMAIDELILVESITVQSTLMGLPIGPVSGILALLSGVLGLRS